MAGEPVWHEVDREPSELKLMVAEVGEISRLAHDELDATAENVETIHWAIAALMSMLRPDMTIAPPLVDRFVALPIASVERAEILARASNMIIWSQPAIERPRLSELLGRAVDALMARSTS